jgi:hypothetical protein
MRPLRAGLVSLHSGGSGQRAGRHYDRSARCSLDGPAPMPVPGSPARSCGGVKASPEMPRWSAERRAGQRHWPVVPGDPGIGPTARRVTRCGVPHQRLSVLCRVDIAHEFWPLHSALHIIFEVLSLPTVAHQCPKLIDQGAGRVYSAAIPRTPRPMRKWSRGNVQRALPEMVAPRPRDKSRAGPITSRADG